MSVLRYADLIESAAQRNGVHPDLLRAMMQQESGGQPGAVSPKGATGLMQLMPGTARRFGVQDIRDPVQNIEGGAKYVRFLLDRFDGNVPLTLAGYNAGEGAVDKYKGIPPYKETQGYVKKIMSHFARLAASAIPAAEARESGGAGDWIEAGDQADQWVEDAAVKPQAPSDWAEEGPAKVQAQSGLAEEAPADGSDWAEEEPGFLSRVGGTLALAPSSAKAAVGGIVQSAGESIESGVNQEGWRQALSPFGALANADSDIGRAAKRSVERAGEDIAQAGGDIAAPSIEALKNAPRGRNAAEQFALDVVGGARDILPALGAGVAGGPGAAAAVIAGQVYGRTYADLRDKGIPDTQAASKATADAIINGGGSMLPIGVFLKAAGPLKNRILSSLAVNAPVSAVQSALSRAYDGKEIGFDQPVGDALKAIGYDVAVGTATLGLAEGAIGGAQAMGRRGRPSEAVTQQETIDAENLRSDTGQAQIAGQDDGQSQGAGGSDNYQPGQDQGGAVLPGESNAPGQVGASVDALSRLTESTDAAYNRLAERYPAAAERIASGIDWSAKDNGASMRRALAEMTAFEAKSPEQVLGERPEPRTLAKAIADRGGINIVDMPDILGENKLTPEVRRGLPDGMFRAKGGRSLDDLAVGMWEDGYLSSPDTDTRQLVTMLQDELAGRQRYYSALDQDAVDRYRDWQQSIDVANRPSEPRTGRLADELQASNPSAERIDPRLLGTMPARRHTETMVDASGAEVPKFAGNINLEKIDTPADIWDSIRRGADTDMAQVRRRGVVSHEQSRQLAADMGLTLERFLNTPIGKAGSAHELLAARQLLVDASAAVEQATLAAENGDVKAALALEQQLLRLSMINATYQGQVAEAGRALNILKTRVGVSRSPAELQELLTEVSSRSAVEDKVRLLKEAFARAKETGSLSPVTTTAKKLAEPGWTQKQNEITLSFMFSNPLSHMANVIGNAVLGLHEGATQLVASGIGKLHRGDKVTVRDATRFIGALVDPRLWLEGLREGARAFKTEQAGGLTKTEGHQPAIKGAVGRGIRVPLRLLQAEDQFFKTLFRSASARQQAERLAIQKGLRGADRQAFIDNMMDRPANLDAVSGEKRTVWERAENDAARLTLNEALGSLGQSMAMARHTAMQHDPVSAFMTTMLLPTFRTPANILKAAYRNSALAPLTREGIRDVLGKNGGAARDVLLARWIIGSALTGAALALAKDGLITGAAPTDPGERAVWDAAGKLEYAVNLGGRWIEYRRYDPYSSVLGIAADLVQDAKRTGRKDVEAAAISLVMGTAKNIFNKSMLSGMLGFFRAVADPERYGESFVSSQVNRAMMPYSGLTGFIGQRADPYYREAATILDRAKARYGAGQALPHRINPLTGEPMQRPALLGGALPSGVSEQSRDPVVLEVARLTDLGLLHGVSPPGKTRPAGPLRNQREPVPPAEYEAFSRARGAAIHGVMNRLLASPQYQRLPDEARAAVIQRLIPAISQQTKEAALGR